MKRHRQDPGAAVCRTETLAEGVFDVRPVSRLADFADTVSNRNLAVAKATREVQRYLA
jgi:hypothetical protein